MRIISNNNYCKKNDVVQIIIMYSGVNSNCSKHVQQYSLKLKLFLKTRCEVK